MTTTCAPTIEEPAYFARLADIELRHWWALGMWRIASSWLDAALAGRSQLRALDVGCGTGLTARRLAERPEIIEVVALEPSLEALAYASERHAGPLLRGSALDLPFASRAFDVVLCLDVFQHLPRYGDRRAAAEIRRVLKPGGIAVVRANGRGWSGDAASYRLGGLTRVLRDAELKVLRASYANTLPSFLQELRAVCGRVVSSRQTTLGHPAGGGLRIAVPSPTRNRLMTFLMDLEAGLVGRMGMSSPFGHTTLVLVERPRATWE